VREDILVMDTKEVVDAVKGVDKAHKEFVDNANARLDSMLERIEQVEAFNDRPPKTGPVNTPKPYREFYDGSQKCFELPSNVKLTDVPELGPKEKCPVSLERWSQALVMGESCGDKDAVDYLKQQKSVATTSTGVLVPEEFVSQWIDMARAQSTVIRAGASTVPMNAKTLQYAHQTADPTFSWRSTEGAALSATDPTFASRTLTAKTVAVRTQVSLEASQDIPGFGEQITRAYTAAFGAAIDQAALVGAGSG
jgi:HK97 family phage major capsid protein